MFLKDPFTGQPSIPFTLYAMECEGELDTAQGKHNRIIKNLRQRSIYEVIDEDIVREEAIAAGLYNPTNEEIVNIMREVI